MPKTVFEEREQTPEAAPAPAAPPAPASPALTVGSANDAAEHAADKAADAVLRKLGAGAHQHAPGCGHETLAAPAPVQRKESGSAAGTIGAGGGDLDAGATRRIESARGSGKALDGGVRRTLESGFGSSLADVRVHDDSRSHSLAAGMNAEAFTTGKDIFLGAGEHSLHTLAHEVAHTRQKDQAAVGRKTIHRKLAVTAGALKAAQVRDTEHNSTGFMGKLKGKARSLFNIQTEWEKLTDSVAKYEEIQSALEKTKGDAQALAQAKPKMLKLLSAMLKGMQRWKEANPEQESDERQVEHKKKNRERLELGMNEKSSDTRVKAERHALIAQLQPRIQRELDLVNNSDSSEWFSSMGFTKSDGVGKTDKGANNVVQELIYNLDNGKEMRGYFKEEKGVSDNLDQEQQAGITHKDVNYGARAVAMYELDKLFSAGVTARTEFAVHKLRQEDGTEKEVLGTIGETAQGVEPKNLQYGMNEQHTSLLRQKGPEKNDKGEDKTIIDVNDPTFQSAMNKLQILDAICGQLDRHLGNVRVQVDKQGKVTGVTGIDLDMAFGESMHSTDGKQVSSTPSYLGLPPYFDEEMGEAIIKVDANKLRLILQPLLSKASVEATVSRFEEVKSKIQEAKQKGELRKPDDWKKNTGTIATWDEMNNNIEIGSDGVQQKSHIDAIKQVNQLIPINNAILEVVKPMLASWAKSMEGTELFPYSESQMEENGAKHSGANRDDPLPKGSGDAIRNLFTAGYKGNIANIFNPVSQTAMNLGYAAEQIDWQKVMTPLVNEMLGQVSVSRIWVELQHTEQPKATKWDTHSTWVEAAMRPFFEGLMKGKLSSLPALLKAAKISTWSQGTSSKG